MNIFPSTLLISGKSFNMLEDHLHNRQIKPTSMRLLVLKAIVESDKALSLADLEGILERSDRATIYRTLKTFEENQLIHPIDDGTGSTKYGLCEEQCTCSPKDQHVHFRCEKCNQTVCLSQSSIPEFRIPTGFVVKQANMVLTGICAGCS